MKLKHTISAVPGSMGMASRETEEVGRRALRGVTIVGWVLHDAA